MKSVVNIKGLDCSACAAELEEVLANIEGMEEVSVSFVNQKITMTSSEEAYGKALHEASHFEEVELVGDPFLKDRTIKLRNLDCANCASELEEILSHVEGIASVTVSFVGQKITLNCTESGYANAIKEASHFEEVEVLDEVEQKAKKIEKLILLKNLDCSACAAELESIIRKIDGVEEVSVSFVNQKITLVCTDEAYDKAVEEASHFEEVEVVTEHTKEKQKPVWTEHKPMLIRIAISILFFALGFALERTLMQTVTWTKWLVYAFFAISFFSVGYSVLITTAKNLAKGKIFDENFLMTIGAIGAIALGEYTEGVAVMLLYQMGEFLQAIAVGSSRRSISDLMELKSETATLLTESGEQLVAPESLQIGQTIIVKVGEKFPVDVVISKGETAIDTKSLSGEAMLRDVKVGSEVLAGSINASGVVEAEVVRAYSDSAVAKILEMVEDSSSKKAKPEKFITKFARIYTPIVFFIALALAGVVPTILGSVNGFGWELYEAWIMRALKVLVISCPCALIISVPLSYFGGIGACASNGILVKGATYLDTLANINIALFDKTGTLTEGNFYVAKVNGEDDLLPLAAALEHTSNHPVAIPFKEIKTPYVAEKVKEVAGKGLVADVNGETVLCGNEKLMQEYRIEYEKCESLSTVLYVARGDEFLGSIEIEDKIKEETVSALAKLKSLGIRKTVMLTGDQPDRAKAIAEKIGIDEVHAGLLPDEKLLLARKLKEEGKIVYAGDGINDAPVMAESDVSISMGKMGSDAAIEASDLVLVSDNLLSIPKAIKLAKRTKFIVLYNIAFSLAVKLVLMLLGIFAPALPLWAAVLGDVGVMLIAVLNSLLTRLKVR